MLVGVATYLQDYLTDAEFVWSVLEDGVNHGRTGVASEELEVTMNPQSECRDRRVLELRPLSSFIQPGTLALGKALTNFTVGLPTSGQLF